MQKAKEFYQRERCVRLDGAILRDAGCHRNDGILQDVEAFCQSTTRAEDHQHHRRQDTTEGLGDEDYKRCTMNRLFNLTEERSRDACQKLFFQTVPALRATFQPDQPPGLPPTQQTWLYQDGNGGGDKSFAHSGWMDLHSDFRNAP